MVKQKFKSTLIIVFSFLLTVVLLPLSSLDRGNSTVQAKASQSIEIDNQFRSAESFEKQSTFNKKVYSNATIEDDFANDSIIVVLDEKFSSFNISRNSRSVSSMFNSIGASVIKDLSAVPEDYLTADGKIDTKNSNARALAEHFEQTIFNQVLEIELENQSKQNVLDTIKLIEKMDGVAYVGPNHIEKVTVSATPNDPRYTAGQQWALIGTNGINAPGAWTIATGSRSVRVGIIDTGIALHDDLTGNLTSGYDFYNNNDITTDDTHSHGTGVAGIIGAVGDNGYFATGVAQQVTLVPLQASDPSNTFHESHRIAAVTYARNLWGTANQISIINHSIGGLGTNLGLLAEIQKFPGLFVWSAGNDGINNDSLSDIYSFSNTPNLIIVGAHNRNGQRSIWNPIRSSSYGADTVHIFAPGGHQGPASVEDCLTTGLGNGEKWFNGTSCSAPHVAGVAALILSHFDEYNLDGAALKNIIMDSVDTSSALENLCVSGGRLNAYKALSITNPVSYLIHNRGTNATVSGDFDGDNYEDVLMLLHIGDRVEIHSWLGGSLGLAYDGLWWVGEANIFNLSNFQGCVFSGDFDGDGKCDVAVFAYVGVTVSIHCLEYNGSTLTYSGVFWVGGASILDLNAAGWSIATGDFDGNGLCDIAVLSAVTDATKVYALRGGSGSFTYSGLTWIGGSTIFDVSIAGGRIATGDFNGDGKCDIAAFMYYGNAFTRLAVLKGTSSGFSYYLAWQHGSFDAGGITGCVIAGDFDGNGRDDIAAIMYYGNSLVKILVWRGTTTGVDYIGSVFEHSNFVGSLITGRVVAGDFNGDGKSDIAAYYKYANRTRMLAWQGTATDFVYSGIIW